MCEPRRCRNGFTLIELCLVLAILGILTALAVRPYNAIRDRARAAEAVSSARTVEVAAETHWAVELGWPSSSPPGSMPPSLERYLPNNFDPVRNGYLLGWNGPESETGLGVVISATDPGVANAFSDILRGPDWVSVDDTDTRRVRDRRPRDGGSDGSAWVLVWDASAGDGSDPEHTAQH